MKTIIQSFSIVLFATLLFTSCQKEKTDNLTDEQVAQQMIVSTEDHATAEDLYQDVEDQVDAAIESRGGGGDCPIVTVDPDWQTYPRTVTIDFGDHCEGPGGRVRKGRIVVDITDNIINPGASRTASFINFHIDGVKIEGSRNWTNQGYDNAGNITLSRTVENGEITYPNGDFAQWESDVLLVQTSGGETPLNFFDNVFEMTGDANGINRNGQAFTVNIDNPLVKDKLCPWLVSGILDLTVDNVKVSLDYGNGTCDKKAILTLPNGTEHEILIHRWW